MNKILHNRSPAFLLFFDWATNYLLEHKKALKISNTRKVKLGCGWCGGWCDGEQIVIAGKSPLFEETFVHEFCHMMQAIENDPVWSIECVFWTHLEKNSVNIGSWDSILEIIELERNCELRAIQLSKKWKLFNNSLYTQRANVYLFFYHFVFLKKKWVNSTGLYSCPKIIKMMPEKILSLESLSKIDMNLMKEFEQCLNSKKYKKVLPKSAALCRIGL